MSMRRALQASLSAIVRGVVNAATGRHGGTRVSLTPGDLVPDFELRGSDGRMHRLSECAGQVVVVAWFPKAFTGG